MSESKNTMSLWDKVETSKPEFTKTVDVNRQRRTVVNAMFQKRKATEMFGSNGIGWGIEVGSEDYYRYQIGDTHLIQYKAILFYIWEGNKGKMPITASIKEAYVTKGGKGYLLIDDEAVKKVRTDAVTKALSELGFNADIHMGLWDQKDYQSYAMEKSAEENQEELEKRTVSKAEEYSNWKENELSVYKDLNTIKAVNTVFAGHARKAERMGDKAGIKSFELAKNKRIEEIKDIVK